MVKLSDINAEVYPLLVKWAKDYNDMLMSESSEASEDENQDPV